MIALRNLFRSIALNRSWWWTLLGINFFGALYGFYWYWPQLQASPRWQWPLIPDSPGSTFLLFIWLGLMLLGYDWKRPGMQWLAAIAFISNMKYGLWTATVLPEAGIKFGWQFDYIYLSLSHAGMWVQAMIFARFYKPAILPAIGAMLFMWFQDLIDYRVLMTHPTLPENSQFLFAAATAVILSTVWGLFLVAQAAFNRPTFE
jgi:uncharacterized membrane protein YpjA